MTKEVIVVLNEARPVYDSGSLSSSGESELDRLLEQQGIRLEPVYLPPSGEGLPNAELSSAEVELSRYYRAEVEDAASNTIIESLERLAAVESAYIKPDTENPIAPFDSAALVTSAPQLVSASAGVPSFVAQQGYLGKKPAGVGTPSAWSRPGGKGQGVTIIDIEGGWCFSHIDLLPNDGLKGGVAYPGLDWRNHGTAVFGEIAGRANAFGVTGIAPEASIGGLSHGSLGSARAIQQAIALLKAGDILLLEMHRPGPRYNFASRPDQLGYIAVEWWPDDLLAIQIASERGIIVVEAAGNGAENLDDLFYDAKGPGFPATWVNPFRGAPDSGAIIVGAGAPPVGYGIDRSRLDFSNFGSRIDCQGWGRGVVTTGYGDLYGSLEDEFFTATFSGTSSASPIVTGAIACLQGIARAVGRPLTPTRARSLLRATGSPQQASPTAPVSQLIGSRPDLAALIPLI